MYGFVDVYSLFLIAMVIITIGEMMIAPVMQTLIANIAPVKMRARYMATHQLSRGVATAIGPLAAGILLDFYDPHWVWYAGGLICLMVALGYLRMESKVGLEVARINGHTPNVGMVNPEDS